MNEIEDLREKIIELNTEISYLEAEIDRLKKEKEKIYESLIEDDN